MPPFGRPAGKDREKIVTISQVSTLTAIVTVKEWKIKEITAVCRSCGHDPADIVTICQTSIVTAIMIVEVWRTSEMPLSARPAG